MARVLSHVLSRVAPLRRAKACDPYAQCVYACAAECPPCDSFTIVGCCSFWCVCC
jgi:hypothetical protein